ncbi:MAG TPA: SagB family peptide dehydrogenase [Chloroflexota bacterium]|nr:SagB family peptide dehydrogenase [Chloroflexota bacterium]
MKRLHHDLNYLTSAGLLIAATITAITGVVAHLWDLNDFWYHTYAGYVMAVFALAHVWLNLGRMVRYVGFRFSRRAAAPQRVARKPVSPAPARPTTAITPAAERRGLLHATRRAIVSRRGFLALALGAASGFFVGRGLRQPPPIPQGSDLGLIYHEWSKPGVIDVFGTVTDWGQQPPLYKTYEQVPQAALPVPRLDGGLPTEEAINRRRSTREYSGEPMTLDELSRMLFLMGGINGERWGNRLRTAPSSGALYPVEAYTVAHNVTGLEPGVYHYGVKDHSLAQLRGGDLRDEVVSQGLSQQFLGQCNIVLFLTVIFQRMRFKYRDRTYRYGLLEAGHLGQNIYLAATSMGLGACAIGAFMDDEINTMLGVDGEEEAAVYMLAVGKV